MANTRTLTSANATLLIGVTGLFDTAQLIQGFSADDVTASEAVKSVETQMGVDGRLSAGWVPMPVRQSIVLMADSQSNDLFENWREAQQATRELYIAFGILLIPATQRKYTMSRGFLSDSMVFPSLKRTLQARSYTIEWEKIAPAPY